jgi:serine/threonine protein kinase
MKTGDIVRDDQGRAFQIGQILGRGLWGKTYSVREEHGPEWALKVPLSQDELPANAAHLATACRDILLEQARLLSKNRHPFLPPLDSCITTDQGVPALLMQRQPLNLERRLTSGCSMDELMSLCAQLVVAVRELGAILPGGHGNLTPENVLLSEQGRIMITDPLTETARRVATDLRAAAGSKAKSGLAYQPPEIRSGSVATGSAADTYAIAMILYWGTLANGEVPTRLPETPLNGLDKASLVALKDRVHNRLKDEGANPRFFTRLSDRTSAFLNRALSAKTAPSPPYRFLDITEFHQRIEHLKALTNPAVEHVGKILLDRPPGSETFSTDEDVVFSCTIGCSPGVETHEEIACGLAVFDREKDERIRNLGMAYTVDRHPSGRHRFGFRLTDLAPGSYAVRVAFKIRESSADPMVAEGRFERRAAPGYIPPRTPPTSRPIPMERPEKDAAEVSQTKPGVQASEGDAAGASAQASTSGPAVTPIGIKMSPPPVRPPVVAHAGTNPSAAAASVHQSVPGNAQAPTVDALRGPTARVAPLRAVATGAVRVGAPRSTEDAFDEEPLYDGAGDWVDNIPIPQTTMGLDDGEDIYDQDDQLDPLDTDEVEVGPIGLALERIFDALRGDAYVMFISLAALLMILLIILLFAIN